MKYYEQMVAISVDQILAQHHNPLLVAITGESGSGKSYFTKALEAELAHRGVEYAFLNHDDFLIPRIEREALRNITYADGEFTGKTKWEVLENWYYLDDFRKAIEQLKHGQSVSYYPYSHSSGTTSGKLKTIEPKRIVLLESKLFLDKMDFVIELRVSRQEIIKRKIDRDSDVRTPEQTIEMHERAQGYYWDRNAPKNSHIIIDNNDFEHPMIVQN